MSQVSATLRLRGTENKQSNSHVFQPSLACYMFIASYGRFFLQPTIDSIVSHIISIPLQGPALKV